MHYPNLRIPTAFVNRCTLFQICLIEPITQDKAEAHVTNCLGNSDYSGLLTLEFDFLVKATNPDINPFSSPSSLAQLQQCKYLPDHLRPRHFSCEQCALELLKNSCNTGTSAGGGLLDAPPQNLTVEVHVGNVTAEFRGTRQEDVCKIKRIVFSLQATNVKKELCVCLLYNLILLGTIPNLILPV